MRKWTLLWLVTGMLSVVLVVLSVWLHLQIGIPRLTGSGLHWGRIQRSSWIGHNIELSWNQRLHIEKLEVLEIQATDSTSTAPSVPSTIGTWPPEWLQEISVQTIHVHWAEQIIDTQLHGTLYPNIQLENDWLSVGKKDDRWQVSGQLNSTESKLPFTLPEELTLSMLFHLEAESLQSPVRGTLQNVELNHPIFGTRVRIPTFKLSAEKGDHGWNGIAKTNESTLRWMLLPSIESPEQSQWAINYEVALSDLTEWFAIHIPNTKVKGHWIGSLTAIEATISGRDLGFEGQIYALHRLQSGQPITYQPIHATQTKLLGPNLPSWIPYRDLGWLAKAVIAGEDASFTTHNGFNEEGLNRALNALLKGKKTPIGGSSITQQLAKNLFTGNRVTLDRKVEEMVYTLALEEMLSKEAILALYLNAIEFGDGIYGIQDACDQYFLKTPRYLTVKEAVFLASILPNPREGYRRSKLGYPPTRRMRTILENLVDGNQISTVVLNESMREPLRLLLPVQ